ncbi:hypothetical protein ACLIA0_10085 [Bacillaceae bacterium W0354]
MKSKKGGFKVKTQNECIIEAFRELGGGRSIEEIRNWIIHRYGNRWKELGTPMADMVPESHGGNSSSNVPEYFRVLERVDKGVYRLIEF